MTATSVAPDRAPSMPPCQHGFIAELVLRCGRGDTEALARLFDLFHTPVQATVAAALPPRRVESSVVQVFVRVWRHAAHFDPAQHTAVSWVMSQADAVTSAARETPRLRTPHNRPRRGTAPRRAHRAQA